MGKTTRTLKWLEKKALSSASVQLQEVMKKSPLGFSMEATLLLYVGLFSLASLDKLMASYVPLSTHISKSVRRPLSELLRISQTCKIISRKGFLKKNPNISSLVVCKGEKRNF